MRILAEILKWFGWIWIIVAVFFVCLNYVMIFRTEGLGKALELLGPFSILNWVTTIVALLPGIVALIVSRRILKKEKLP